MTVTKYDKINASFSDAAHLAARELIYPKIFKIDADKIRYEKDTLLHESERGKILDGEMGVDRIVKIACPTLSGELIFTVQERFRRPAYQSFQDVTITEWNHASNLPSELYKINAGIFLYAFYDQSKKTFTDGIAFSTTNALLNIANGGIKFNGPFMNKKQQTFIGITYREIERANCMLWRYAKADNQKRVC
ncbi:hypothetical protein EOM81_11920 [bacterium]|nr:hypothetical protein [bacterium]